MKASEMDDTNYPNLEKMCRLCLKENCGVVEIFPQSSELQKLSVSLRIITCAALEVQANDGLPKYICMDCRYQLEKAFYFRKRCQVADSKLRKHIRLLNLGKKSRIFSKNNEDDDDDELEFHDSSTFIKEYENLEQQNFKNQVKSLKMKHFRELLSLKRRHLKKSKTLYTKMQMDLQKQHTKFKTQLEQKIRMECEEIVLKDIENFLKEKRRVPMKNVDINAKLLQKVQKASSTKNFTTYQNQLKSKNHFPPKTKLSNEKKTYVLEKQQSLGQNVPSETVSNEDNKMDSDDMEDDVYIIEAQEAHGQESSKAMSEDEDFENIEADQFYENNENNSNQQSVKKETTSYQIEENGEIQILRKPYTKDDVYLEDENILIVGYDNDLLDDIPEIDNFDDKVVLNKRKPTSLNKCKPLITDDQKLPVEAKKLNDTQTNKSSPTKQIIATVNPLNLQRNTQTPKTFQCTECPMVASTSFVLSRHMKIHKKISARGITYECEICHIWLSCKSALNRHKLTHTGEKPHKCDECNKSFVQREVLKRHMQIHTTDGQRPHKCDQCDRSFTSKVNLKGHIVACHTNKPLQQNHSCHFCMKRFAHASGLSRHLASHSGLTFQCVICKRIFIDRSSIKRHINKIHKKNDAESFIELMNCDGEQK